MSASRNLKTIFAFFLGIAIGIFLYRNFFEEKKSAQQEIPKVECPPPVQQAEPQCPISNAAENKTEVSEEKSLEVVKLEDGTFPAPQFSANMPKVFETKHPGEFKVQWEKVPGVVNYRIRLLDKKGNPLRFYTTDKNIAYIQRIPWDGSDNPYAFYSIYLASLNEEGAEGPKSEIRKVKLFKDHAFFGTPEKVNPLVAPEIKSITTED